MPGPGKERDGGQRLDKLQSERNACMEGARRCNVEDFNIMIQMFNVNN